jgi:hypothetical protein
MPGHQIERLTIGIGCLAQTPLCGLQSRKLPNRKQPAEIMARFVAECDGLFKGLLYSPGQSWNLLRGKQRSQGNA